MTDNNSIEGIKASINLLQKLDARLFKNFSIIFQEHDAMTKSTLFPHFQKNSKCMYFPFLGLQLCIHVINFI